MTAIAEPAATSRSREFHTLRVAAVDRLCEDAAAVMFADELADLKDRHASRFSVMHVLSREPRDVELFTGRLDAARLRELLTAFVAVEDLDHAWVCGPHAMVCDTVTVLTELGLSA